MDLINKLPDDWLICIFREWMDKYDRLVVNHVCARWRLLVAKSHADVATICQYIHALRYMLQENDIYPDIIIQIINNTINYDNDRTVVNSIYTKVCEFRSTKLIRFMLSHNLVVANELCHNIAYSNIKTFDDVDMLKVLNEYVSVSNVMSTIRDFLCSGAYKCAAFMIESYVKPIEKKSSSMTDRFLIYEMQEANQDMTCILSLEWLKRYRYKKAIHGEYMLYG